ncbi:zinc transport system permease protein [Meinhardsimonia xiamenensis]|jgi:zinc transport system permease protein|uniref:High-affinity zinc uptake system membrane protein ZnuB n=1 Tax=Meinhardsimonia xiamenensis TaxID=990712 RepID=A0A1G8YVN0_9RHOB|nr:iron chelate uptake ABC transporter family permease subunit [Meinhardsimonia xiamenensis]PRX37454.1 zinc transport system permease protein [Meinhardsimonia xiamenensis]SDK06841.1 zinc transport system permease protein [Meinhardsimonia xiamenensis]
MPEPWLLRALLAGLGVAVAAGPLGAFVVWRRMAYFGDATAHAAILGVAIALGFGISVTAGTLAVALAMALAVSGLAERGHGMDAALGVIAHSALALGLVAVSFVQGVRVDLAAFLFGDILAVGPRDVAVIWSGAAGVALLLAWRWQALLTATLNDELAVSEGIDPRRERLVLTVALALMVAVALQVVGALLISAMLIVPATAARALSRSPETMAVWAVVLGALSVVAGLWGSLMWDTPAGPSIVTAAAVIFVALLPLGRRR